MFPLSEENKEDNKCCNILPLSCVIKVYWLFTITIITHVKPILFTIQVKSKQIFLSMYHNSSFSKNRNEVLELVHTLNILCTFYIGSLRRDGAQRECVVFGGGTWPKSHGDHVQQTGWNHAWSTGIPMTFHSFNIL